ncbi:MAG: hypothetical protein ACFCU8_14585 [Thermosynechococcaceae cyanobacterium]
MNEHETRAKTAKTRADAARAGHNAADIVVGSRASYPPDRWGEAPHAARNQKDKSGGKKSAVKCHSGHGVLTTMTIYFTGDSMKDIADLVAKTGRGGPGSGETWHHGDRGENGYGPVYLMQTTEHARISHMQGSAQARVYQHGGNPDNQAKLCIPHHPYAS